MYSIVINSVCRREEKKYFVCVDNTKKTKNSEVKHIKNGKYTACRYVKHSNKNKIWGIEYRCQGRTPHPIYNTIHGQPRPKIVGHWHAYRYLKYNEKAKHFLRRYMKHNNTIETQGVQVLGIYQEKQNTGYAGT